ncbi:hypothetical protein VNI00_019267 [Paramarasmius palmivorus]|uniref:Uncharacterized protein n=1 Tax=Paramarasmius palmivorus TaxID=297713 RepID=A0AAW0ANG2_9AGAR
MPLQRPLAPQITFSTDSQPHVTLSGLLIQDGKAIKCNSVVGKQRVSSLSKEWSMIRSTQGKVVMDEGWSYRNALTYTPYRGGCNGMALRASQLNRISYSPIFHALGALTSIQAIVCTQIGGFCGGEYHRRPIREDKFFDLNSGS